MRKLLQSKAFVGCLCVAAAACVTVQVLGPRLHRPVAAAARSSMDAQDPGKAVIGVPSPLSFRGELTDWRSMFPAETLIRDPFSPAPDAAAVAASKSTPQEVARFVLQGVSIEPEHSLAVVNHHIVGVGDKLEGFTVESIQPAQVWMSGPQGKLIVSMDRDSRHPKKNRSEAPASADPSSGPTPAAPR